MKNFQLPIYFLLVALLIFNTSCASNKNSMPNLDSDAGSQSQKVLDEKNKEEKDQKIDHKKLAKEAGYMVAWDLVLAAACKNGLHFSIAVCLTADVMGDAGIIAYHSLEDNKKVEKVDGNNTGQQSGQSEKKFKFNPLEFVMGVGLMAIMLVII